jgi:hypothetical protein
VHSSSASGVPGGVGYPPMSMVIVISAICPHGSTNSVNHVVVGRRIETVVPATSEQNLDRT